MMQLSELMLLGMRGIVIKFAEAEHMVRALLRVSEYTTRRDSHCYFTVEDYAARRGLEVSELAEGVGGIMCMDYYFANLIRDYGRDRLSSEESEMIRTLHDLDLMDDGAAVLQPFFVVAISPAIPEDQQNGVIRHELAHVAYRSLPVYREAAHAMYRSLNKHQKRLVIYQLMSQRS